MKSSLSRRDGEEGTACGRGAMAAKAHAFRRRARPRKLMLSTHWLLP
ncbi:hypothetical protein [Novosphingobium sp. AP12]|nr:hypothetical protein [Novosphingobium sp. AP12]